MQGSMYENGSEMELFLEYPFEAQWRLIQITGTMCTVVQSKSNQKKIELFQRGFMRGMEEEQEENRTVEQITGRNPFDPPPTTTIKHVAPSGGSSASLIYPRLALSRALSLGLSWSLPLSSHLNPPVPLSDPSLVSSFPNLLPPVSRSSARSTSSGKLLAG